MEKLNRGVGDGKKKDPNKKWEAIKEFFEKNKRFPGRDESGKTVKKSGKTMENLPRHDEKELAAYLTKALVRADEDARKTRPDSYALRLKDRLKEFCETEGTDFNSLIAKKCRDTDKRWKEIETFAEDNRRLPGRNYGDNTSKTKRERMDLQEHEATLARYIDKVPGHVSEGKAYAFIVKDRLKKLCERERIPFAPLGFDQSETQ
ncbi:unnamed protein product [Amoebophrya sp. A25]|nr:unnamed protein product [Amoebophrya sp. A25]|eukprot:GSA25T00009431001.1